MDLPGFQHLGMSAQGSVSEQGMRSYPYLSFYFLQFIMITRVALEINSGSQVTIKEGGRERLGEFECRENKMDELDSRGFSLKKVRP